MKRNYVLLSCILNLIVWNVTAQNCGVSAVYGGGPFYNSANATIPEIKASGFNTVIVWTIHIDAKGNLDFNAEFPLVANGKYIGTSKHPGFAKSMTLLKTPPSSVTRIEFGLSASGSSTFANIKTLINTEGTSSSSMLYKNFKALKDSVPALDAFNFDDESTYDVASSVKFAVMLSDLGFKIALCPYTNSNYWTSVASQTNTQRDGSVDKIFLQCYDGGAGNNPCSWNFNGIPIYPGLWDTKDTPSGVQTKMTNWKTQCSIQGGFMWLYDDFKGSASTKQYANALNTAFGISVPGKASNDGPANGAMNISFNPTLKWVADNCAASHTVYFGNSNPPALVGNQVGMTYVPPAPLDPNTTYYWRVDEKNYFGTSTGTVWSFTTQKANAVVNVNDLEIQQPVIFPNPFSGKATIIVAAYPVQISMGIYNMIGERVILLPDRKIIQGENQLTWDGTDINGNRVAPGIYFLKTMYVSAKGKVTQFTQKLVLQEN